MTPDILPQIPYPRWRAEIVKRLAMEVARVAHTRRGQGTASRKVGRCQANLWIKAIARSMGHDTGKRAYSITCIISSLLVIYFVGLSRLPLTYPRCYSFPRNLTHNPPCHQLADNLNAHFYRKDDIAINPNGISTIPQPSIPVFTFPREWYTAGLVFGFFRKDDPATWSKLIQTLTEQDEKSMSQSQGERLTKTLPFSFRLTWLKTHHPRTNVPADKRFSLFRWHVVPSVNVEFLRIISPYFRITVSEHSGYDDRRVSRHVKRPTTGRGREKRRFQRSSYTHHQLLSTNQKTIIRLTLTEQAGTISKSR